MTVAVETGARVAIDGVRATTPSVPLAAALVDVADSCAVVAQVAHVRQPVMRRVIFDRRPLANGFCGCCDLDIMPLLPDHNAPIRVNGPDFDKLTPAHHVEAP